MGVLGRQDHTNPTFRVENKEGGGLQLHEGEGVGIRIKESDGTKAGMEDKETPPAPGDKRQRVTGKFRASTLGWAPCKRRRGHFASLEAVLYTAATLVLDFSDFLHT